MLAHIMTIKFHSSIVIDLFAVPMMTTVTGALASSDQQVTQVGLFKFALHCEGIIQTQSASKNSEAKAFRGDILLTHISLTYHSNTCTRPLLQSSTNTFESTIASAVGDSN